MQLIYEESIINTTTTLQFEIYSDKQPSSNLISYLLLFIICFVFIINDITINYHKMKIVM